MPVDAARSRQSADLTINTRNGVDDTILLTTHLSRRIILKQAWAELLEISVLSRFMTRPELTGATMTFPDIDAETLLDSIRSAIFHRATFLFLTPVAAVSSLAVLPRAFLSEAVPDHDITHRSRDDLWPVSMMPDWRCSGRSRLWGLLED